MTNVKTLALGLMIVLGLFAHARTGHAQSLESLTVAGGCFWCVEADFEQVQGVKEAVSGFTGGTTVNPTYKQVTGGSTGHYEAVQITFDSEQVQTDTLLAMFFRSIDPTDAGGQFCDRGAPYRTAIFATPDQEQAAKKAKEEATAELGQQIVTPILPAAQFYAAGSYHQDYYKQTGLVFTRFGPKTKAEAYKAYRKGCKRDARVKELWGASAPFAGS
jgi:peptide-methionine (S)-S-oxide reductase